MTDLPRRTGRKTTFSAQRWVWLEVWGRRVDGTWYDDGGLVVRLLHWMSEEGIDWRSQRCGGGGFVGRIPLEHEERVIAWLTKEKVCRTGER